jgi:hypothetical protein
VRAGDTLLARVSAHRRGALLEQGAVTARFTGPGGGPDRVAELAWDPAQLRWLAEVGTDGWEPGEWAMAVRATAPGASGQLAEPVRFTLAP